MSARLHNHLQLMKVQQLHQLMKVQQLHQLMKVQQLHQLTKVQTETPATITMNLQLQRKYVPLLKFLTLIRMSARLHNHLQLMKVQQLHQLTKVQTETPATTTMNLQLQR
jgi:hypothetical protein